MGHIHNNTIIKAVLICVICATTLMSGCLEVDEPVSSSDMASKHIATSTQTKWKSSDEGVISYLDTSNYIGQTKTVEGTIVRTFKYAQEDIIFLNFHNPYQGYFTAIIWSSDWNNFPFAPEVYYKGKDVRVTGNIIEYKGTPEIVVRYPSQIEVAFGG